MKKHSILGAGMLLGLVLLVTGCPHNEYILELTPHGSVVERKLTFYRADGEDSGKKEEFPTNELARIARCYPPGSVKREAERYVVARDCAGAMPEDIGGAGSYTNVSTSLGSAGFYVERFRGNDDPAGVAAKRLQAADQLTDLVIGWAQEQFGKEAHFQDLRRFLDVRLRQDLKNFSSYFAPVFDGYATQRPGMSAEESSKASEQALEEFGIRFGQYLVERGYLKSSDVPGVLRLFVVSDERYPTRLLQRLLAEQLKIADSAPRPESLTRLADPAALAGSWEDYLVKSDYYKAKVQEAVKVKSSVPPADKPNPSDVTGDLFFTVAGLKFDLFGNTEDHLVVKLALTSPPIRTNGRWDETLQQVLWDSNLESGTNTSRLPVLCYASWSDPDANFQKAHFGRVILTGDNLQQYCLWFAGLESKRAVEWATMLVSLRSDGWNGKLAAFRFSGEPTPPADAASPLASDFPRALIQAAGQSQAEGK